uniref:Polynucleotide 5'-hydroxyl-kinase NOL9 n=1 Tax=Anopheles maculatus TaxID=74869 RepID=A0A182S6Q7_9DIPT
MTSAKRPKKASDEATASGWSVESGDCRPSNEGNSKSWAAKPVTKNKYRIPLPTNTNARPQVVAYKRKGLSVEDLYDTGDDMTDDSEWSTDEDYDGSDLDYGMYDEDDFDDLPYQHVYSRKDFDDFDGEYGDSEDSSGSSDSFYRKYILKGERYDSGDSSDEEYEFVNDSNTVYIPYGSAIMRDLSDDKVEFNPENEHGQIIDLPNDNNDAEASVNGTAAVGDAEEKAVEIELEEHNDDDDGEEESDNSCPEAVPINPAPAEYQFYNAVDLRMSLAVLKSPIYMYGHLSVQVLSGMLEMWGYQLDVAEKRTVYASGGYNAINLTPLPTPKTFSKAALERIVGKLKPHFIESDIDALMKQFDPATCVLVLLRADLFNASDTVPLVCKLLPDYTLFPTALTLDNGSPFRTTEMLLEIALFQPTAKNVPLFQANRDWRAVQLQPYSRLVVVGGKGTGKSTLCQYLINRHIKKYGRVLLIDLDIGQPLLFLPETISVSVVEAPILGVGCFADVKPLNCQLFGSFNVVSSPQLYLEIVSSLLQYCDENRELEDIPWIINTMGYVVGFGAELTNAIIRLVQPTDLVQLTVPKLLQRQPPFNKIQNYANQLKPYLVNAYEYNMLGRVLVMQPSPLEYRFYDFMVGYGASSESFNPPRRRTIAIMAQLVKILGDTAESFADVKPHMAHINDLEILITRDEHRPSKEMLLSTLNATMVYLCEKLPNGLYNCFGVGIVRSVDDKENVFLLHSLSPEQLAKAKVLALCNTSLPSQVYLQDSPNIEGTLPYLQNVTPATATNQPA